ncbi:hypothetical protein TRFO_09951 [Tritrichomonas foetus]|uniref:Myb-like DNA-binding domain containing protein n=1 Tax=Tritrichomonas foetus TaxID=1144522 RepID=A0A1J4JFT4_9EUKA|nr:hypothetical protein TRFO_09951 [Tritrichomonas foetus]|eukprot:OHS96325.1 hypothetical protein TRFO_09951 [Tritrichomonas foetus]
MNALYPSPPNFQRISENSNTEINVLSAYKKDNLMGFQSNSSFNNAANNRFINKTPWSQEEDETIRTFVKEHGTNNWAKLAQFLPGRVGKQCRERWRNFLDPNVKHEPWTQEEDDKLIRLHEAYGNHWVKIALFIPGRSDNTVKNRWNSTLKKLVEHRKTGAPLPKRGRPKKIINESPMDEIPKPQNLDEILLDDSNNLNNINNLNNCIQNQNVNQINQNVNQIYQNVSQIYQNVSQINVNQSNMLDSPNEMEQKEIYRNRYENENKNCRNENNMKAEINDDKFIENNLNNINADTSENKNANCHLYSQQAPAPLQLFTSPLRTPASPFKLNSPHLWSPMKDFDNVFSFIKGDSFDSIFQGFY